MVKDKAGVRPGHDPIAPRTGESVMSPLHGAHPETAGEGIRGRDTEPDRWAEDQRPDWWLHVRPSNTEPIVRLIAEARTEAEAKKLIGRAQRKMADRESKSMEPQVNASARERKSKRVEPEIESQTREIGRDLTPRNGQD